ncbi:MAG: O-antigen ligase family protein [Bacteroidota bacterium]|nr:O-antigen ligase family protein [Bacteroidota bacterium]
MEIVKYIILIAGGGWFIYSLLNKPERIAVLLFTTVIADINFDLPGIHMNFRALLTLALLIKVLADAKPIPGPSFFSTSYSKYIILFVIYVMAVTYAYDLLDAGILKEYALSLVCAYLGFYYYLREGGYRIFKLSIILAGFSCLGDLVWTYMQGGGLWIQRIYFSFTPSFAVFNHNFFGYICAIAFVFLLADYLTEKGNNKWNLLLMPVMFMGVLLSTSRSSLLILIIISVILITRGLLSRKNSKKAYKLVIVTVSCLILALFLFQILNVVFSVQSEFIEQITARLIDEPVAIINRALGNDFKADKLDSMDWRAEASQIAYDTFVNKLESTEQMFGIGLQGFMERHYGYDGIYDAHNGPLLMLIEFGVVGTLLYFAMLVSFITRYIRLKLFSPLLVSLVFIILFVTSHNRELISPFVFLITGSMAGELQHHFLGSEEVAEEELPQMSSEYQ